MLTFLAFLFGLIIGSFLNVVILRLPNGQKLSGRSVCPKCRYTLTVWDLVPVFSFIGLRGKCRNCRAKISFRYVVIELLTALGFAWAMWFASPVTGQAWLLFSLLALVVAVGIVTFVIDLEHYLILDTVTGFGVMVAIILQVISDIASHGGVFQWPSHTLTALLGMVVGVVPFWLLWFISRGKWLGFGDVKYAAFLGATLGYPLVVLGELFAFWAGAVFAIPLLLLGKRRLGSRVPFGTFLVVGQVLALVWGERLLRWYTQLFK